MIFTVTLNPAVDREYVVPKLIPNSVLRASEVHIDYGGKGFNVSRMLSSLGVPNNALGLVGGSAGDVLEQGLFSLGISTDFMHVKNETRVNTSIVQTEGQDHIKVNEVGPDISDHEIGLFIKKVKSLVKPGDWWVLSGSLPPGINEDFYQEMIHMIQSAGARAALDTSGQALISGVRARPHLIKPNVIEANTLTEISGHSLDDLIKMIKKIHANGIHRILISAGKDASIFSDGVKVLYANPPAIRESNPVGAGDAMLAGVLYGFYNQLEIEDSFAWGIAAGSAAACKTGTSMPTMSEVEKLKKEIEIQEINNAV